VVLALGEVSVLSLTILPYFPRVSPMFSGKIKTLASVVNWTQDIQPAVIHYTELFVLIKTLASVVNWTQDIQPAVIHYTELFVLIKTLASVVNWTQDIQPAVIHYTELFVLIKTYLIGFNCVNLCFLGSIWVWSTWRHTSWHHCFPRN